MVTNSLCIHHARKESRHCKKERKIYIYIPEDNDQGLQRRITNYLNSAGSHGRRMMHEGRVVSQSLGNGTHRLLYVPRRKQVYSPVDQPIFRS